MRRLILEDPYSKAALLSRRLAVFALFVAVLGIAGVKSSSDLIAVLGGAAAIAVLAVLAALLAFAIIWFTGRHGGRQALFGLILAILLLAYPAYVAQQTIWLPRLYDISTDIADPPNFSISRAALAARNGATPPSLPLAARKPQLKSYPQIEPILLDLDAKESFDAVLKAVAENGWRVVEKRAPGGRMGLGHVDAIATSFLLRFPSDVTVRIRPLVGQTRIDVRSAARFGPFDFGAPARNIANFDAALDEIVNKKQ
jgi:uncharacterized protein (DUF1499 family)